LSITGNPVNFFPVYEPSSDRVAAIQAAAAEENNPLNIHYDASREVRAKGAGFYQFSADDETRKKEMEELRQARNETEMTRQELGAVDLKAGEVEGMQQEASNAQRNRAVEKRKRELEERRKLVEAKRRKLLNGNNPPAVAATQPPATGSAPSSEPTVAVPAKTMAAPNPNATPTAADDFLAALERDLAMNKR
jgi:hypothetical protein